MTQTESMDADRFEASLTRRSPIIALGANLLLAPLGHVYVGQAARGFVIWGATLAVAMIAALLVVRFPGTPAVIFLGGTLGIGLGLLLVDVVAFTKQDGAPFEPRPYNQWYGYLGIALLVILVDAMVRGVVREQVLQTVRLTTESMSPTLLVGDHLIVDKTAPARRELHRGDIVVIPYPNDPTQEFVKRIVGLPNETVEVRGKQVYINGRRLNEPYAVHLDDMTLNPKYSPRDNMAPLTLGPHALFLLGDNRDNSNDSRFWGPLADYQVRGKTIMIYWSWDPRKSTPRWDRVGSVLSAAPRPEG
jgi:signal peptidase I